MWAHLFGNNTAAFDLLSKLCFFFTLLSKWVKVTYSSSPRRCCQNNHRHHRISIWWEYISYCCTETVHPRTQLQHQFHSLSVTMRKITAVHRQQQTSNHHMEGARDISLLHNTAEWTEGCTFITRGSLTLPVMYEQITQIRKEYMCHFTEKRFQFWYVSNQNILEEQWCDCKVDVLLKYNYKPPFMLLNAFITSALLRAKCIISP